MEHSRTDTGATLIDVSLPSSTTEIGIDNKIPSVIPPSHPFRTLVLCFDGTGDQFDGDNSNVVQFFSTLKRNDEETQLVYYQTGIGTITTQSFGLGLISSIYNMVDTAIAWNLHNHVMGGYKFLMQNYRTGDRICIFGFSRGAYTARGLAGMIHKVGLLPRCNHEQVPFAYKMFSSGEDEFGEEQAATFKASFAIDVDIEFVGVWDTVSSVGLYPQYLPFTSSNSIIKTFRHAVSLDEHRAKFKANLWHYDGSDDHNKDKAKHHAHSKRVIDPIHRGFFTREQADEMSGWQEQYAKWRDTPTDVEEVWFAGAHCDVGGGSVKNETRFSLARIPLRWMIRECFKANSGIMFSSSGLRKFGIDPATLYDNTTAAYPLDESGRFRQRPHLGTPKNLSDLYLLQETQINSWWSTLLSYLPSLSQNDNQESPYVIRTINEDDTTFTTLRKHPIADSEEDEEFHDALSPLYDPSSLAFWKWALLEVIPLHTGRKRQGESLEVNWWRPRKVPRSHWIDMVRGKVKVHRSVKFRMDAILKEGERRGEKYLPRVGLNWEEVIWVD